MKKTFAWIGSLALTKSSISGCSMSRADEKPVLRFTDFKSADELATRLRVKFQLEKRKTSVLISALKRAGAKCTDPKDVRGWPPQGIIRKSRRARVGKVWWSWAEVQTEKALCN